MRARSIGRPLLVSLVLHGVAALVVVALGRRPLVEPPEMAATSTIVAISESVAPPTPPVNVDVVGHPASGGGRSGAGVRGPRIRVQAAPRVAPPAPPLEPAAVPDGIEAPPAIESPATTGGDEGDGTGEGSGEGPDEGPGLGLGGADQLGRELHARVLGDEPVDVRAPEGVAILSHDQATALRQRDTFPRLPESVWPGFRPYIVRLQVCVAEDGHVADAVLRSSASARLDKIVRAAVRTWRYQPWLVAGAPTAFCHGVVIKYERW